MKIEYQKSIIQRIPCSIELENFIELILIVEGVKRLGVIRLSLDGTLSESFDTYEFVASDDEIYNVNLYEDKLDEQIEFIKPLLKRHLEKQI